MEPFPDIAIWHLPAFFLINTSFDVHCGSFYNFLFWQIDQIIKLFSAIFKHGVQHKVLYTSKVITFYWNPLFFFSLIKIYLSEMQHRTNLHCSRHNKTVSRYHHFITKPEHEATYLRKPEAVSHWQALVSEKRPAVTVATATTNAWPSPNKSN